MGVDGQMRDFKTVPFGELLESFVPAGEETLAKKMKSGFMYETAALGGAKDLLREMLALVSRAVLFYEFSALNPQYKYRSAFDRFLGDDREDDQTGVSREQYNRFIQGMLNRGNIDLFNKYPLLAGLMKETAILWVDFMAGFFSALERDRHEIAGFFFNQQRVDNSSISVSFEDATNFGNFTGIVTFANHKLVYKPRNIDIENSFDQLIQWLNNSVGGVQLKAVKVLNRKDYGWAEFVQHRPCETEEQVKNFYLKSGMLLGILYIFSSIDMHNGNLIACGEHPVLTDLEGLVGTNNQWDILSTNMLPAHFIQRNGNYVSYNTLAAETVTEKYYKDMVLSNINTDAMRMGFEYLPDSPKSVVKLNGDRVFSYQYSDQVLEGFTLVYAWIMDHSDEFLDRIRQLFKGDKVRFFFRSVAFYISILYRFLQPANLKETNKNGLWEQLAGELAVSDPAIKNSVINYEYESLGRLVIPRFYINLMDGKFESFEGLSVTDLGRNVPYNRIEKKVRHLSRDDLIKQHGVMQNAFNAYRNYYKG